MSRENYLVFTQGKIGKLTLKNRLIRSATCEYKMAEDGTVTDAVLNVYNSLAKGGVGMIITGLMAVSSRGKGVEGQAYIYDDVYIEEVAKIAATVHCADSACYVIAQLCHPGRQLTHENVTADCVGPSEMESPLLEKKARGLSIEEIETIISDFVTAIVRAKQSGFDGVQLHAAHGYLLSSFLSPYTNQRTDDYGGSMKNRVHIIRKIISMARMRVDNFPIIIKINCDDHVIGGITKDTFPDMVKEVATTGVDAIEVSGAIWDCLVRSEQEIGFVPIPLPEARTCINTPEKQSYYYEYIKNLKLPVPLILVGGHRNIENMESILQERQVDFLSLSRPMISEPDLPNRWRLGIGDDRANCVSCNACFLYKDEFSCALKRLHLNKAEFEVGYANGWRRAFK